MKKIFHFLKSMQFGIILLTVICVISVIGSLIPQEYEAMYYVRTYSWYSILLALQFDHIFTSWYFIVLVLLLCMNLTLCSILRFRTIRKRNDLEAAEHAAADVKLTTEEIDKVEQLLTRQHCRKHSFQDVTVYEKNSFGRYGTFITHLGILLTVIFFALAMYVPQVVDESCYPGESIVLEDGAVIHVEDFHIEDEEGNLDYRSTLTITLPGGETSAISEASVNHPVKFGSYKVYQHTYGTIGKITIRDEMGNQDVMYLEDGTFLSKDGKTGIWYNTLYADFSQDGDDFSLTTSVTGSYPNPVYTFNLVEYNDEENSENDLKMTSMLAFPGDEIQVGDLTFHFDEPVEYPGLRIKIGRPWINVMLIISFVVMIIGFAVTFLFQQVIVSVTKDGYKILGNHREGIRLAIEDVLEE